MQGIIGKNLIIVGIKETEIAALSARRGLFDHSADSISATQIGFFYFIAATQFFSRTGIGDIAGFDNIGLMGQRQGQPGILLNQNDSSAIGMDVPDNFPNFCAHNR